MTGHIPGFERYLRVLEGLKESSIAAYVKKVREFIAWIDSINAEGPVVVEDLRRQDIEAYLEYCFYRHNGNQTRAMKLTALGKFFRYLRYEGIIADDLTEQIPKPRIAIARIQKFTRAEVLALFKTCNPLTGKGLRDIVIFILAVFCGLRTAEIYGLTMESVVDDDGDIDIYVRGKKDRERKVYLWKAPGSYVRQYMLLRIAHGAKPGDPLLVSYRYKRPSKLALEHTALSSMLHHRAKLASIRKTRVNMHMFRATHASDLRHIRGYDAPAIAERLGHSNIATTDRYLPERGRIHRIYQSLDHYWSDFKFIWRENRNATDDRSATGSQHTTHGGPGIDPQG